MNLEFDNPLVLTLTIFSFALFPFLLLSVTSFVKLSVVFGVLRNALGAGQIPSQAISFLLAIVLSVHIMTPVSQEMYQSGISSYKKLSEKELTIDGAFVFFKACIKPLENFMKKHSFERERLFFAKTDGEGVFSLIPAFVLSQLSQAFIICFIIFLPFLVVDLLVSNILVGLGMLMVSPVSITLPIKIMLFVLCDGWFLLSKSLVLSYA